MIAYALAHKHTVVTQEVSAPASRRSVKIPDVCDAFSVPVLNTFGVLEKLKARFILDAI